MENISSEKELLQGILELISRHFGPEVEVVLHDLIPAGSPHSILDIRNGHITGRAIGDCADKHGIQAVAGECENDNCYNEVIYTESGAILRCSTYSIKNKAGEIIGSICINQDITKSVQYEGYLRQKNGCHVKAQEARDINEILSSLIQQAIVSVGKHPSKMSKEEKISFIKYLDDRGAFLVSKSGPRICEIMGISKFTLYSYLEASRSDEEQLV